jgi:hypothetical protein
MPNKLNGYEKFSPNEMAEALGLFLLGAGQYQVFSGGKVHQWEHGSGGKYGPEACDVLSRACRMSGIHPSNIKAAA